jgi:hypothetical protein
MIVARKPKGLIARSAMVLALFLFACGGSEVESSVETTVSAVAAPSDPPCDGYRSFEEFAADPEVTTEDAEWCKTCPTCCCLRPPVEQ